MITKVLNLLKNNIYNVSLCTVCRWNGKITAKFCKSNSKLSFFVKYNFKSRTYTELMGSGKESMHRIKYLLGLSVTVTEGKLYSQIVIYT